MPLLHAWKAEGRIRRLGVTHHDPAYFGALATWISGDDLDFVQIRYSIAERRAEDVLLALAADHGVAVTVNMPLEGPAAPVRRGPAVAGFRRRVGDRHVVAVFPQVGHLESAVTVALPATSDPQHLVDNMAACHGPLPDPNMRARMLEHMRSMPGCDRITGQPWYPGKDHPGIMSRDVGAIRPRKRMVADGNGCETFRTHY